MELDDRGWSVSLFSPQAPSGNLCPLSLLLWTTKLQRYKIRPCYNHSVISSRGFSHTSGQVHQQHLTAHFMAINKPPEWSANTASHCSFLDHMGKAFLFAGYYSTMQMKILCSSAPGSRQMQNTDIKTFTRGAAGSLSEGKHPWNFYLPWHDQLFFLSNPLERFCFKVKEKNIDLKQFD